MRATRELNHVADFDLRACRSGSVSAVGCHYCVEALRFQLCDFGIGVFFLGVGSSLHLVEAAGLFENSVKTGSFHLFELSVSVCLLLIGSGLDVVFHAGTAGRGIISAGVAGVSRAEQCVDSVGELPISGIKPVAGARFIREPAVRGEDDLVRLRLVCESLLLAAEPEHLRFSVSLADVSAELDQFLINCGFHGVWFGLIAGALDRDRSLVICVAGAAPAPVVLVHDQADAAVVPDPVVAACVPAFREAGADRFGR